VEKARSHQSVDWLAYFKSIQKECPWSYSSWLKGSIDIVEYQGYSIPLGEYDARMYVVNADDAVVEALAAAYDNSQDEWLFSYPGYGPYATPVKVLIQQHKSQLEKLRKQQDANS
jgi:hypothetical protein